MPRFAIYEERRDVYSTQIDADTIEHARKLYEEDPDKVFIAGLENQEECRGVELVKIVECVACARCGTQCWPDEINESTSLCIDCEKADSSAARESLGGSSMISRPCTSNGRSSKEAAARSDKELRKERIRAGTLRLVPKR